MCAGTVRGMKASDITVWLCIALILGLFGFVPGVFDVFNDFSRDHDGIPKGAPFGRRRHPLLRNCATAACCVAGTAGPQAQTLMTMRPA